MRLIRIYKNIAGWFLILLFALFFWSITLNVHIHTIDGVTVVHSHPYRHGHNSHDVNHTHSADSFLLIHFLSHFIAAVSLSVLGNQIIRSFKSIRFVDSISNSYHDQFYTEILPRGPPSFRF